MDQKQLDKLARVLSKNFISRSDVIPEQRYSGAYIPRHTNYTMGHLRQHLRGEATYGHYLLDAESKTKVVAFDIDFMDNIWFPNTSPEVLMMAHATNDMNAVFRHTNYIRCNGKDSFVHAINKEHPDYATYTFMRTQARMLAERLCESMHRRGLRTFTTISGNKGLHVYGLMPEAGQKVDARKMRKGGLKILQEVTDQYTAGSDVEGEKYQLLTHHGGYQIRSNKRPDSDSHHMHNMSIELFPKQDTVGEKGFGNLLRLEFGKNVKNPDCPTGLVDQRLGHDKIVPLEVNEAIDVIQNGNPWRDNLGNQ